MKKIENKKNIVKNKFTKFFRASLLSLFVMLTIPSISSGIFGNGDAEAGCKPLGSSGTFILTQAQINNVLHFAVEPRQLLPAVVVLLGQHSLSRVMQYVRQVRKCYF